MADQEFELNGKLRIRSAKADDAKDLQNYCFPNQTVDEIAKDLKNDLADQKKGKAFRIVVTASDHAIGQVRIERSEIDKNIGEIGGLSISPPFRSFHIPDKLVAEAEKIASENGMQKLQIEVNRSDATIIDAYKKWGFAEKPTIVLEKNLSSESPSEENDGESDQQELL